MKKILVADDDLDIQRLVKEVLLGAGYKVAVASNGKETLDVAEQEKPDLILLDIEMPQMSGFEVCQKLKLNREFKHVPILMLTARTLENDEIKGFEMGVDDYITKPFKAKALLARVQAALDRTESQLSASPLTQLPGNASILKELEARIREGGVLSVFYFDLNNFKSFNDHYGFLQGDKAIQLLASILDRHFRRHLAQHPFVGHVGGDDFVAILASHDAAAVAHNIIEEFDQKIVDYYSAEDRQAGGISAHDRHGKTVFTPIMGLAVAVVTNKLKSFTHPGEIALIAGELKTWVKSLNKSAVAVDRRS